MTSSGQVLVVGLGGPPTSGSVLAWAVAEASTVGAALLLAHACPPDSPLAAPGAGTRMSLIELADPVLARAIASARAQLGGHRVRVVVRPVPPGRLLVDVATSADLVVVGAPTRPGWRDRAGTTHTVVRNAPCPTVVVRPSLPSPSGSLRFTKGLPGHVVVGVDGSVPARSALEFGFDYAARHHRPLLGVHVVRPGQDRVAAEELLEAEMTAWQHKYVDVVARHMVVEGEPLDALLEAADGAVLLVVGNRGKSFASSLFGSVSHGAVDRARCPLAVVHSMEQRDKRQESHWHQGHEQPSQRQRRGVLA